MSRDSRQSRTDAVLEVEFAVSDSTHPFVGVSEAEECRLELAEMIPRGGDTYAEFFNVIGTDPERVVDAAAPSEVTDASLVRAFDDGGLVEFQVPGSCPAVTLADLGAIPREIEGANGDGRIVAEVLPRADGSAVIETFLDENPDAELASKREKEAVTPLFSDSAFEQVLHAQLTDRQREVLRAAFEAGYYEWPRECAGEEVAEKLGISSATFSEHISAAERKLLAVLFDGQ